MKPVLIIGAFEPEIDRIARAAQRSGAGLAIESLACGVGNTAAALALQERLLGTDLSSPSEAIFIGSAGRYDDGPYGSGLERFTGFAVEFENRELAALEGRAHIPELMTSRIETTPGPAGVRLRRELGAVAGRVNSPDSLTLAPPARMNCEFENMEAFGLAAAATRHKLPFCALLALTNKVGPEGSLQWREHHRLMSIALQEAILNALSAD